MLINRLVLNLRDYSTPLHRSTATADTSTMSRLSFKNTEGRILGNIGAPLDHGQWDDSIGWVDAAEIETSSDPYEDETAVESRGSRATYRPPSVSSTLLQLAAQNEDEY